MGGWRPAALDSGGHPMTATSLACGAVPTRPGLRRAGAQPLPRGQRIVAHVLGKRQIAIRLRPPRECIAHAEEVGSGLYVVQPEDVRAVLQAVRERGEGSREALPRRAPGERADEVLA